MRTSTFRPQQKPTPRHGREDRRRYDTGTQSRVGCPAGSVAPTISSVERPLILARPRWTLEVDDWFALSTEYDEARHGVGDSEGRASSLRASSR